MRAEDEPITLKEKACRPVCRRQSVMIERGNPLFAVTQVTRKVTKFREKTAKANRLGLSWTDKGIMAEEVYAPKVEDRSLEETEWQEQGAREEAWKLAKSDFKIQGENKATFFSPSENWCLTASTLKPEEREFGVESGASMHMISKKDLHSAELEIVTTSRSPTTVATANGEVQTHEEATVYVKELEKSWLWKSSRTRQQYCRQESFAMKTDTLMNGSIIKNHIS